MATPAHIKQADNLRQRIIDGCKKTSKTFDKSADDVTCYNMYLFYIFFLYSNQ
jgi:hypothetical protein